jgi:hypothetical protein
MNLAAFLGYSTHLAPALVGYSLLGDGKNWVVSRSASFWHLVLCFFPVLKKSKNCGLQKITTVLTRGEINDGECDTDNDPDSAIDSQDDDHQGHEDPGGVRTATLGIDNVVDERMNMIAEATISSASAARDVIKREPGGGVGLSRSELLCGVKKEEYGGDTDVSLIAGSGVKTEAGVSISLPPSGRVVGVAGEVDGAAPACFKDNRVAALCPAGLGQGLGVSHLAVSRRRWSGNLFREIPVWRSAGAGGLGSDVGIVSSISPLGFRAIQNTGSQACVKGARMCKAQSSAKIIEVATPHAG